jgi:hypothetical protein
MLWPGLQPHMVIEVDAGSDVAFAGQAEQLSRPASA